jgi:hypothetical protein
MKVLVWSVLVNIFWSANINAQKRGRFLFHFLTTDLANINCFTASLTAS